MINLTDWSLCQKSGSQLISVQGKDVSKNDEKYLLSSPLQSVSDNAVDVQTASKSAYRLAAMNPEFQKIWTHKSQMSILTDACRHNAEEQQAKSARASAPLHRCAGSDKIDSKPSGTEQTLEAPASGVPKTTLHNLVVPEAG